MKRWLAPLGTSHPGLLSSETEVARKKSIAASIFAITTALSLAGIIAPAGAAAAPPVTSFQFTTTVDATTVGGDAAAPLRILYQYNPDLAAGSGPIGAGETFASYGPLEKVIVEVGDQCVSFSGDGTGITVFNNAGTTFVEDSYDVRADVPATVGKQLFGLDFTFTRFLLVDSAATMFTSTALPTSPAFADEADFQQTVIELADPVTGEGSSLHAGDAPYALTTFDPPAQIGAILDDVRALQVRGSLIQQLAAPLEDARAQLAGTLTQKNLNKGVQQLQRFINLVNANRRTLGGATADSLVAFARETIDSLPACV